MQVRKAVLDAKLLGGDAKCTARGELDSESIPDPEGFGADPEEAGMDARAVSSMIANALAARAPSGGPSGQ